MAHDVYLAAARRLRLTDPERDWHVLASAITAILNSVLQYCALVRARSRLPEVLPNTNPKNFTIQSIYIYVCAFLTILKFVLVQQHLNMMRKI